MASITPEPAPHSPTQQHQQPTHPAHPEDDSAFDSLVESSRALLEALQTWVTANTRHTNKAKALPLPTPTPAEAESGATADPVEPTADSSPASASQNDTESLLKFDAAWTSYYNFFEAWKDKDAQRLLRTLLDHAQQIEALWCTVQSDPTARAEWGPRIEEQRKDLRDKARQLAGPDGVARLDEVFANFVTATTPALLTPATPPANTATTTTTTATTIENDDSMDTDTDNDAPNRQPPVTEPSSSSASASLEPTASGTIATKKRQRVVSVSEPDSAMDIDEPATGTRVVPPTTPASTTTLAANADDLISTTEEPQPKRATKPKPPRGVIIPDGVDKQEKWTNLQLIHELALDPNFKIESKRAGGSGSEADGSFESLESRIRAMATKAYFDKIREDAEQGQLGRWISPLLTTIREQLLDMVPQDSAMATQISEGLDIEFVQQQVDRKVYDVKGGLQGVLGLMAKLCAPVRDETIRQIQQDLSHITGNPLQQQQGAQSPADRPAASATSVAPKDLVSVLKDILDLLEEMLMDLANFRLMVNRPSLQGQAIPYEQNAFKTSLAKGEATLDATTAWLEASAASLLRASAISTTTASPSSTGAARSTPFAATTTSGSPSLTGSKEQQSIKTNRHYEVYVNAVLDLLYSKTPLDQASRKEFPETFALDQGRLTRYQNEIQALGLIAVMLNVSLNVQPTLRDEAQTELKETLFRLMESADTSKETLAEAIIEAKEKALLLSARTSSSSSSSPSASARTPPTTALLLSAEQKSYLRNTIEKAISFDSNLYNVLSQRLRKVLESYLLSTNANGQAGVMPEQAGMNKIGLGAMAKEIETFATQIGFLIKYNAKVYQRWYDPILTKILPGTNRSTSAKPRTPASAASISAARTRTVASATLAPSAPSTSAPVAVAAQATAPPPTSGTTAIVLTPVAIAPAPVAIAPAPATPTAETAPAIAPTPATEATTISAPVAEDTSALDSTSDAAVTSSAPTSEAIAAISAAVAAPAAEVTPTSAPAAEVTPTSAPAAEVITSVASTPATMPATTPAAPTTDWSQYPDMVEASSVVTTYYAVPDPPSAPEPAAAPEPVAAKEDGADKTTTAPSSPHK
ncbi:hypothetical protein BGX29_006322 [Mortierella sp. GBA35]|nr:hypothetical protein BGX29_006322 [Mortierella sp. GBA35]